MRVRLFFGRLLLVTAMLAMNILAGELGSVSGVVQDPAGKPLVAAIITLTCEPTSAQEKQTTSDTNGQYELDAIPTGACKIVATFPGYTSSPAKSLVISEASPHAQVSFVLTPANASGSSSEPLPPQGLKLQAAGVRGLIDPGGYSAPANAAAASGLIQGMADIERNDKTAAVAGETWPCHLEPELRAAVEANPGSAVAKQNLGNFYVAHGQSRQGEMLLEQAHRMDDSSEITRDLAIAQLASGDFVGARQLLTGLAAPAKNARVHQLLAQAEEGSGMFRAASEQYRLASDQDSSEENLFGLGYELILAGAPGEAASAFADALKKVPDSTELLIGAGSAEFLQGRMSEGISRFLRATELTPGDPRAYVFLASVVAIPGPESKQVREAFRRFAELAPNNADALYDYALNLRSVRTDDGALTDMDKIQDLLRRAIQLQPNFYKAHFQLGTLYEERGDFPNAVREYEAAVRLAPEFSEAHYRLAKAYRHDGQLESAKQEMRLFEEMRKQQTQAKSDGGMDLARFISVLAPKSLAPAANAACEPK